MTAIVEAGEPVSQIVDFSAWPLKDVQAVALNDRGEIIIKKNDAWFQAENMAIRSKELLRAIDRLADVEEIKQRALGMVK